MELLLVALTLLLKDIKESQLHYILVHFSKPERWRPEHTMAEQKITAFRLTQGGHVPRHFPLWGCVDHLTDGNDKQKIMENSMINGVLNLL